MLISVIKIFHLGAAAISISGFIARFLLRLTASAYSQKRWLKIAPHIVDTILFVSGILLVINTHWNPLTHAWLGAKLLALLAYIIFGLFALRFTQQKKYMLLSFLLALASFAYIIAAALSKNAALFA